MRKQITSLLLTLAMLLSLVPTLGVTASAADDTSYGYADINNWDWFKSYLSSDVSRDLTLMKDINYTVDIDDDSIDVMCNQKLDLNGHKITIDASKRAGFENLLCIRRGEFTLYDSKGGGELAVSFPNDDKAYSIIMMSSEKKDEPSKFTMNGGTLTKLRPNMTYTYGASGCIGDDYFNKPENGKRSQITINGGTINCSYAYKWDRSKPLLSLPVKAMPLALQLLYSNLTINGGTFNGIVWTDNLWRGTQDTEPRVVLNGGEFNSPFVVEDMSRTATQMVIDGAHFNDGFYVDNRYSKNTDVGTVPQLLLKSGVFDSPDKNPKLDIYNVTAAHGDSTITKNRVILHAMKCFPNSAIKVNGKIYTSENINSLVRSNDTGYYLKLNSSTPIEVIRDAWGVMESVKLDGKSIDYARDWKGAVEEMDNSKAHTLTFQWKPLAQELKDAGYTYRTKCEHYISGSTAVQKTETIDANKTSHTVTIPKGADPKVYSYDLQLNLDKNGSSVGIISNEHIVKLVVSEAPEVKILTGKASYINSAVFGKPVLFSGTITPGVYIWECQFQWQRSTDGGSTWKDIPNATDGQYIPGAADMGENVRIRVVITKKGYLGEIVSAPAKVSKAANDKTPAQPNVTAQKNADGTYTAFQISNFKSDQEYIYTTSAPTSGNGWPTGGTPITSATVNGLNQGSTYYIFTRYKDTDTHQTGSKVSSTSVLLDNITMLNRVILTDANGRKYNFYGSGNIIYIKKGESVTLTAKTNPVGATTWSGFTFKSQYSASAPFTVTAPTGPVASGSTIPSVTIRGDTVGTGTLAAEYGGYPAPQSYGTWRVHVYENVRDIGTAADIIVAPSFPDLTMRPGETMPLPEYAVSVYPKGALDNYTLEWRIIKVGSGGAAYSMRDDHITLENGKIEPTKAHTGSEKTRLELVAVNKTKPTDIRSFSPSVGFYITVGDAPVIELTGLTLTPKKVDLEVGKTCQLSAVKEPANAEGSLTWTSSKPAVAAVDKSGKVTAKGEGTATITVTCGTKSATCTVTVSKPLVPEVPGTSFTDVPTGVYYEEAVGWAVEKGITKGTSDSTFTPDGVCTRAQAVTFLWRAAGSPAAKAGSLPFADVKAGSYYDDAVRWAVENGVTVGTSATTFSPNATCSRAQIVTFLWRAQKSPAAGSANPFDDVAGSAYYADAVQWAVQKDITKGTGATAFSPDANCIRAQIVTFLYRSMK